MKHALLRVAVATAAATLVTVGAFGPAHAVNASIDKGGSAGTAGPSSAGQEAAGKDSGKSDHSRGNASTRGEHDEPQPESTADKTGGGANSYDCEQGPKGPYCSTRDGSASANGEGDGQAKGRPCAGCVGKADNKNPRGQEPGPSDRNNGYECDGNKGIAKGNPAHTGCTDGTPVTPETPPVVVTPECPEGDMNGPDVVGCEAPVVVTPECPEGDMNGPDVLGCEAAAGPGAPGDAVAGVEQEDAEDQPVTDQPAADGVPAADEVAGVSAEAAGANRAPVTLSPAAGILPQTGAGQLAGLVVAGLAMLLVGAAVLTRRRPQGGR